MRIFAIWAQLCLRMDRDHTLKLCQFHCKRIGHQSSPYVHLVEAAALSKCDRAASLLGNGRGVHAHPSTAVVIAHPLRYAFANWGVPAALVSGRFDAGRSSRLRQILPEVTASRVRDPNRPWFDPVEDLVAIEPVTTDHNQNDADPCEAIFLHIKTIVYRLLRDKIDLAVGSELERERKTIRRNPLLPGSLRRDDLT